MQISYTLIVALMYVTILSFGLASLLSSLSSLIKKDNNIKVSGVHLHWIIILLVIHFNMTWHAVYLADLETWTYVNFILVVLGPILGSFAATVLTPFSTDDSTKESLVNEYLSIKPQVLLLFISIQCWILLADRILERGLVGSAIINVALILLSVFLLISKKYRLHQVGIGFLWIILLTGIVMRGLHIIE